MNPPLSFVRRWLAAALILTLVSPSVAFAQQAAVGDTEQSSALVGKLKVEEGSVAGSKVLAYHLSSEKLFTSEPTGANGEFQLPELPYGYFDVAVETPDGLYVANQVVNLPPSGKVGVTLELSPNPADGSFQARSFPGSSKEATGTAQVKEKPKGKDFWTSTKGIAILATVGGVALLALASSSDSEDSASPN